MKIFRMMLVATVFATNAVSASRARADHDVRYANISNHAEMIVCASRDLNEELRYRFHDSRRYGDLLATNARIRSKANYLQAQARPWRNSAAFLRFLAELDEQICRMDALIDEARFRANRGIDPWLGNTRFAEAHVAQMREAIQCIERELSIQNAPPFAVPFEEFAPSYPRGAGSDRGYDPRYRGFGPSSGHGIALDRDGINLRTGGLSVHFDR